MDLAGLLFLGQAMRSCNGYLYKATNNHKSTNVQLWCYSLPPSMSYLATLGEDYIERGKTMNVDHKDPSSILLSMIT